MADPDIRSTGDTAPLSRKNIKRFADLVHRETGIVLNDEKSALMLSRLHKRLVATRIESFDRYYQHITSAAGADERRKMLHALTTNVTRFYRESHHFADLRDNVLPAAIPGIRAGRRFRVWSSACSTGEEPYSIAMEILSVIPDAARYDIRILATDFNEDVVDKARRGVYPQAAVQALPAAHRELFFTTAEGTGVASSVVAKPVRDLVRFNSLNLVKDWPMRGKFDVIFCRNVMIYFNLDTQEMLLERLAGICQPGGTLYIGHSERVSGLATSWFLSDGLTTYRRAAGAAPNAIAGGGR